MSSTVSTVVLNDLNIEIQKALRGGDESTLRGLFHQWLSIHKKAWINCVTLISSPSSNWKIANTTPLILACELHHTSVVELLLEQEGIDVNRESDEGTRSKTPLVACLTGSYPTPGEEEGLNEIKLLLAHKKIVHSLNKPCGSIQPNEPREGHEFAGAWTPLGRATYEGRVETVRLLLTHDSIDVNKIGDKVFSNLPPLSIACRHAKPERKLLYLEIIALLLEHPGIDPMVLNYGLDTAIWIASSCGNTGCLQKLLDDGRCDPAAANDEGVTPLIIASYGNRVNSVSMLLTDPRVNVNAETPDGSSALDVACERNHDNVVRLLIETGKLSKTSINKNINNKGFALFIAAGNGYLKIVQQLLQSSHIEINMSGMDNEPNWISPLYVAAQEKHIEIVKLFLERYDLNLTNLGQAGHSLRVAVENDDGPMVDLLLSKFNAAIVNAREKRNGYTALIGAAQHNLYEIMKTLLNVDGIDANATTNDGQTPLMIACGGGNADCVKLLLSNKSVCDRINQKRCDKTTALDLAAYGGHLDIVVLLLEQGEIEIQNPPACLFHAAQNRHELVCIKLLELPGIDYNSRMLGKLVKFDNEDDYSSHASSHTLLYMACQQRLPKVVRILLEKKGIDVAATVQDRTPLAAAVMVNDVDIVNMLMAKMTPAQLNKQTSDGNSLLHTTLAYCNRMRKDNNRLSQLSSLAPPMDFSDNGHLVLSQLLENKLIDVNATTTKNGCTALFFACDANLTKAAKLILKRNDVDVNLLNKQGKNALHVAIQQGNLEIVSELLLKKDIDVFAEWDLGDNTKAGPLNLALLAREECGKKGDNSEVYTQIARVLLDYNEHVGNGGGKQIPPLVFAVYHKRLAMFETLLNEPSVDVNAAIVPELKGEGETPLYVACMEDNLAMVQLLLTKRAKKACKAGMNTIDINKAKNSGATPLFIACQYASPAIVELLLSMEGIDVYKSMNTGETPFYIASCSGNIEKMRMMLERAPEHLNSERDDGRNSFFIACASGNVPAARFLMAQPGIDINHTNRKNETALWIASYNGHFEIVRLLLNIESIALNVAHEDGTTAITIARRRGYPGIAQLLREKDGFPFNANQIATGIPLPDADDKCAVCLCLLDFSSETCQIDGCGHLYHVECLESMWLASAIRACPGCRHPISLLLLVKPEEIQVTIQGLQSKGGLPFNGRVGTRTTYFPESGRYAVVLDCGKVLKVKPTNMVVVEEVVD